MIFIIKMIKRHTTIKMKKNFKNKKLKIKKNYFIKIKKNFIKNKYI